AQGADPQGPFGVGDAGRAGIVGVDGRDGWFPGVAVGALGLGPAVVGAGAQHVDLVPGAVSELGGVGGAVGSEGDALHVAVSAGVDGRVGRVVVRDGTVGGDAQDLAVEGVVGRRVLRFEGVTGPDPQVAVGSDGDPAAVVAVGGADPV